MKKSKAHQPDLIESFRDAGKAEEYLNASLEEGDPVFLLLGAKMAQAQGGVAQLAEKTNLSRKSRYKMLSERGNPAEASMYSFTQRIPLRRN